MTGYGRPVLAQLAKQEYLHRSHSRDVGGAQVYIDSTGALCVILQVMTGYGRPVLAQLAKQEYLHRSHSRDVGGAQVYIDSTGALCVV